MNGAFVRRSGTLLLVAIPCLGSCIDFKSAESAFCAGATPAQRAATGCPDSGASAEASQLAFLTNAQVVAADACSAAVQIAAQDSASQPARVQVDTLLALSATPVDLVLYSDGVCTRAITDITLSASSSEATIWFKGHTPGPAVLTVSGTQLGDVQQNEQILQAGTGLVFVTAEQNLAAGQCSSVLTLQTQTDAGTALDLTAPLLVSIGGSPDAGFLSFSDASCSTPVDGVTVPTGAHAASFYVSDTLLGALTLTASAPGFGATDQDETVDAGAASQFVFTTLPVELEVAECSPIVSIQSQDAYGHAAPLSATGPTTVALTAPSMSFFLNVGCTTGISSLGIPAGQSEASFYFKASHAGNPAITASVSGGPSGSQNQTIVPGPPTQIVLSVAPSPIGVNTCVTGSVQLRDQYNEPTTTPTVLAIGLFAPLPAAAPPPSSKQSQGVHFYVSGACSTQLTAPSIPPDGSTLNFNFNSNVAGSTTITASAAGFTDAVQSATFQ